MKNELAKLERDISDDLRRLCFVDRIRPALIQMLLKNPSAAKDIVVKVACELIDSHVIEDRSEKVFVCADYLSVRTANAMPVLYMRELAKFSEYELLEIKNVSLRTISEVARGFDKSGVIWECRYAAS